MTTVTIPEKLTRKGDLIVIPRQEYEALLEIKKSREFAPSVTQKKALLKAERNFKTGKTFSYHELVKKLGFRD